MAQAGQITATEAARTHFISPTVISYWRVSSWRTLEGPTRCEKTLMKEKEQYKKLLAEAHREIDVLKKQGELRQRHIKLNTSVIGDINRIYICSYSHGFVFKEVIGWISL